MDYILIRSRRKTISIEINEKAQLLVRAPMRVPKYEIEKFLVEKDSWIRKHMKMAEERMA
ncbi:MAG TPA: metal-dependent hydrolase, partial [Lachnospiraceae bacterium]|nr:metal-dependent hydrolase [Lachnospiraceae bacterium]